MPSPPYSYCAEKKGRKSDLPQNIFQKFREVKEVARSPKAKDNTTDHPCLSVVEVDDESGADDGAEAEVRHVRQVSAQEAGRPIIGATGRETARRCNPACWAGVA